MTLRMRSQRIYEPRRGGTASGPFTGGLGADLAGATGVPVNLTPATVFFNPSCSTSRTVKRILAERGVEAHYVRYLERALSRGEIEVVLCKLGADDPRVMMRTAEGLYRQLGLVQASRDELLDAMVVHPDLIQRPIVVMGDRAVIARPAERALDLLDGALLCGP